MPSLFTSESVTEGHPDKLADQISDAILDAILAKDPLARVACEAIVTTGLVIVVGEITTDCYVDIPRIIRRSTALTPRRAVSSAASTSSRPISRREWTSAAQVTRGWCSASRATRRPS